MQPLNHFRHIFPSYRLIALPDELRYEMNSEDCGRIYESVARRVILRKGLPLVADLETWSSRGVVREIALVVREAPEQDVIERTLGDEVPDDEGLNGGWWNTNAE